MAGRVGAEIVLRGADGVGDILDLNLGLFQAQAELGRQLVAEGALIGGVEGVDCLLGGKAVALTRHRGQGGLGRPAPQHIALIRSGQIQLIAGAQLGAVIHRTGVGAGDTDHLLLVQPARGLIERGRNRRLEDIGDQGGVFVVVAIIAQLVRPLVS
ncbi:hypothetical protein D3C72_1707480 [compost metagenome]